MKKIRVGILGMGNQGINYGRRLLAGKCPEVELTAVCDCDPQRIALTKEKLGSPDIAYFEDFDQMLCSGLMDGCIITVPHYDHPKFAIACMEQGVHVLVDKPAGVYTKQVREMNEVAACHDVVFGMMFNQRTHHTYRKMRELVQSGEYGQIRRTNWIVTDWYRSQAYYDSGAWRATWSGEGGGVLMNQCPHQLDLWQWICGMPTKVTAHMKFGKWHDIEVEDDVTAFVEYENGATGVFITSTGDPYGTNRFEIQMDKAKLVADDDTLSVWVFEQTEQEFSKTNTRPFGRVAVNKIEVETDGENMQHEGVINAWAGAILRGEPMVAGGEEGIYGLTLSNAMHLSAWLGKTVELPFDEELYYEELMKRVATSRRKTQVKAVYEDTAYTYAGAKDQ